MIHVANSDEFRRLLEALAYEVGTANIHWKLYRDLHAALDVDRIVRTQSQTFWYLTLSAHAFAAIHSLSRAYDQNPRSLHLLSWLKTIEANLHLFDIAEFKIRLAGNPFVDSLAEDFRMPDPAQLAQDIALCSIIDPKVTALVQHRSNIGAHTNARMTAKGRSPAQEFGIPIEDFEVLLDRAHEIVNRYSILFIAGSYSRQIIGHDDYRYIFHAVKTTVEHERASWKS